MPVVGPVKAYLVAEAAPATIRLAVRPVEVSVITTGTPRVFGAVNETDASPSPETVAPDRSRPGDVNRPAWTIGFQAANGAVSARVTTAPGLAVVGLIA